MKLKQDQQHIGKVSALMSHSCACSPELNLKAGRFHQEILIGFVMKAYLWGTLGLIYMGEHSDMPKGACEVDGVLLRHELSGPHHANSGQTGSLLNLS